MQWKQLLLPIAAILSSFPLILDGSFYVWLEFISSSAYKQTGKETNWMRSCLSFILPFVAAVALTAWCLWCFKRGIKPFPAFFSSFNPSSSPGLVQVLTRWLLLAYGLLHQAHLVILAPKLINALFSCLHFLFTLCMNACSGGWHPGWTFQAWRVSCRQQPHTAKQSGQVEACAHHPSHGHVHPSCFACVSATKRWQSKNSVLDKSSTGISHCFCSYMCLCQQLPRAAQHFC